jgi:S1-C subfamily serine protease
MSWRRRAPGIGFVSAAVVVLVACGQHAPELTPEQRLTYEAKPAVVRVNAYVTARFSYPAREIRAVAKDITRTIPDASVRRLSGAANEEVETGFGVSGSGFIINPSGYILTGTEVSKAVANRSRAEAAMRRNGATAALVRHFSAEPLRQLAGDGRLEPVVERLARSGEVSDVSYIEDVELANGERYGFERRRVPASLDDMGMSIIRIRRRNLPALRVGDSAPVRVGDGLWIVGFPSVTTVRDEVLGGWVLKDADLEATLNPGTVTSVGSDPKGRPRLVTDAAVYRGNEGGPAISRGDGSAIGLVLPAGGSEETKGILPIDTIKEFVGEAGVAFDGGGDFQTAYRRALDSIEEGRFEDAKGDLAFASQLFPNYPDLIRLIAEAERRGQSTGISTYSVVVVVFLSFAVILLGGLAVYFAIRAGSAGAFEPPAIPPVTREILVSPSSRDGSERVPEPDETLLGKLTILSGDRAGERIGLGGSGIRVGREHAMCEIVLENPKVSRLHAEFVEMNGRVLLIDRNSSNGTYVNDRKIDKRFLEDGDIIYFGGRNAIAVAFNG